MAIKTRFTKKENADSGLALLLITLLVYFTSHEQFFVRIALVELLVVMVFPVLFYPFTFVWLNLSDLVGKLMSKVILTIIFFVFVCPVGLFRKLIGKDSLKLNLLKKKYRLCFS